MTTGSKHIVVALRMAGIAGQDKLSGIFGYLAEGHRWNLAIYRTRHEFTAQTVRDELAHGASGFIVGIPESTDAFNELARTDVPVIFMNVSPDTPARCLKQRVLIKSDAEAVGRTAARTLLAQGVYKSYGYVGYRTDVDWSRERGSAFSDELQKSGFEALFFDLRHVGADIENRTALTEWLASLPKPCGLLAACDDRAYEIVEACRENGLRIPSEIGLLGVNNDPILCENSNPKISSVQPDFRHEGYLAAQLLDNLLSRGRSRRTIQSPQLVGIRQVVLRESTYPLSNAGLLIQKAVSFIERNAAKKLSVNDVARHLKVSRSLLDLRFRELQQETVHDAIIRARIETVKMRLKTSADSIDRISADCGWGNANSLKNAFRRVTGQSMRSFRVSRHFRSISE